MPFQDPGDWFDAYAAQLKREKAAKRQAALRRALPVLIGVGIAVVLVMVAFFWQGAAAGQSVVLTGQPAVMATTVAPK